MTQVCGSPGGDPGDFPQHPISWPRASPNWESNECLLTEWVSKSVSKFQASLIEILPGSERLAKFSPYNLSPAPPSPLLWPQTFCITMKDERLAEALDRGLSRISSVLMEVFNYDGRQERPKICSDMSDESY